MISLAAALFLSPPDVEGLDGIMLLGCVSKREDLLNDAADAPRARAWGESELIAVKLLFFASWGSGRFGECEGVVLSFRRLWEETAVGEEFEALTLEEGLLSVVGWTLSTLIG